MKKLEVSEKAENEIRRNFKNIVDPEEYRTIGGNIAIVFSKKAGGECPWIGVYYTSDQIGGEWIPCAWTDEGKILSMSKSGKKYYALDLDILADQPMVA